MIEDLAKALDYDCETGLLTWVDPPSNHGRTA